MYSAMFEMYSWSHLSQKELGYLRHERVLLLTTTTTTITDYYYYFYHYYYYFYY